MRAQHRGLEFLARLGYAARGTVYLIIGLLALTAAASRGGEATGSRGALLTLLTQPLGYLLLAAVGLGLFGFGLWRVIQSLLDADGLGAGTQALVERAAQAVSAVVHFGLALFAASILLGLRRAAGDDEQAAIDWTRLLLAQPFGRWLVGLAGVVVIGAAIGMAIKAWKASFTRRLSCDPTVAHWVRPLGRLGYAARGLVFLILGGFLIAAAYHVDPSEARGLGGSLLAVRDQPFGPVLFGIAALGLMAFGAFGFVEARYRRIDPEAALRRLNGAAPQSGAG
jgi:hypothetical protein